MIKFVIGSENGVKTIGLGVTSENIELLKSGKPILVKGTDIGFSELEILVLYGKNEEEIGKILEPYITDKTKINIKHDT